MTMVRMQVYSIPWHVSPALHIEMNWFNWITRSSCIQFCLAWVRGNSEQPTITHQHQPTGLVLVLIHHTTMALRSVGIQDWGWWCVSQELTTIVVVLSARWGWGGTTSLVLMVFLPRGFAMIIIIQLQRMVISVITVFIWWKIVKNGKRFQNSWLMSFLLKLLTY